MTYYDLGTYSRPITTSSDQAQLWFDRGLVWLCGYNHEAATSCFQEARAADPACAMAQWGIAAASGPNYNRPWETFEPEEKAGAVDQARRAIEAARASADRLRPAERALIDALPRRWPEEPVEEIAPFLDGYADAMRAASGRQQH